MRKVLIALWLQALMGVCAPIGVSTPLTFDERLADDIAAVSQIRTTTTALLREGKISSDDAQHVRAEADKARSDLDVARALHETDTNGGNAQLASIRSEVEALQTYLHSKRPLPPSPFSW